MKCLSLCVVLVVWTAVAGQVPRIRIGGPLGQLMGGGGALPLPSSLSSLMGNILGGSLGGGGLLASSSQPQQARYPAYAPASAYGYGGYSPYAAAASAYGGYSPLAAPSSLSAQLSPSPLSQYSSQYSQLSSLSSPLSSQLSSPLSQYSSQLSPLSSQMALASSPYFSSLASPYAQLGLSSSYGGMSPYGMAGSVPYSSSTK